MNVHVNLTTMIFFTKYTIVNKKVNKVVSATTI